MGHLGGSKIQIITNCGINNRTKRTMAVNKGVEGGEGIESKICIVLGGQGFLLLVKAEI